MENRKNIKSIFLAIITTFNRVHEFKSSLLSTLSQINIEHLWGILVLDNTQVDKDRENSVLLIIRNIKNNILYFL